MEIITQIMDSLGRPYKLGPQFPYQLSEKPRPWELLFNFFACVSNLALAQISEWSSQALRTESAVWTLAIATRV